MTRITGTLHEGVCIFMIVYIYIYIYILFFFFVVALRPNAGHGLLILYVF